MNVKSATEKNMEVMRKAGEVLTRLGVQYQILDEVTFSMSQADAMRVCDFLAGFGWNLHIEGDTITASKAQLLTEKEV